MRSERVKRSLERITPETKQFVEKYSDIVFRIHELLNASGLNQKDLAIRLGKSGSEISKWLSGNHNLTLKTITRIEVELGATIINVPSTIIYQKQQGSQVKFTVYKNIEQDNFEDEYVALGQSSYYHSTLVANYN